MKKEDLDKSIQDKLDLVDDSNVVTEEELEDGWSEAMRNAGLDTGPESEGGGSQVAEEG